MLAPNNDPRLKPSLENLITILRDRSLWPEGFEWDYDHTSHCAAGLVIALGWASSPNESISIANAASRALGISLHHRDQLFFSVPLWRTHSDDVKPEHVATHLEEFVGDLISNELG